mgnify:CR=1 FL=1
MSAPYLQCIYDAIGNVKKVLEEVGDEYTVIVTADHGGHDRTHGTLMPEDMTIPVFIKAPGFAPGSTLQGVNIKDLAPTIAALLGVSPAAEWEGKALI